MSKKQRVKQKASQFKHQVDLEFEIVLDEDQVSRIKPGQKFRLNVRAFTAHKPGAISATVGFDFSERLTDDPLRAFRMSLIKGTDEDPRVQLEKMMVYDTPKPV
jgi:hypothetical protein